MTLHHFLFATALAAAPLCAQTGSTSVPDVGLTMDGGMLTVIYGQSCGPFTCQPFTAGPVGIGQPRVIATYGAHNQLCVLAIALPGIATIPCQTFPGLGNALVLQQPITLAIDVTSQPWPSTAACQQGRATYQLLVPNGAPLGLHFQVQALAMSASQNIPAFTVALRSQVQ